jgi:inorganic pyrophosphatase
MTNYFKLPTWADTDHVYAVVETPRGSRVKLEFDPKLGVFTLAKPLFAGLTYPYDWGFIPSTQADDGTRSTSSSFMMRRRIRVSCRHASPSACLKSCNRRRAEGRVFVVPDSSPFEGDQTSFWRRGPRNGVYPAGDRHLQGNGST